MIQRVFYSENDLDALGILSRPTRWRLRQTGEFPAPVRISKGRVAYPADAIKKWIAEHGGELA